MSNRYASRRIAIALCDRCGFQYRRRELQNEIVKGRTTNVQVCPECWDPDHPQLHLGETPVSDPQAIMDPRPDVATYPESREQVYPMPSLIATAVTGGVTVSTT